MSMKNFRHPRLDASENAFLRRELEHVRTELYKVVYPQFTARSLVPVDHKVHSGAEVTTYNVMDIVGKPRVGGGYSTTPPRVDVSLRDVSQPIKPIFEAYGYSMQEVRNGMLTGRGLPSMKAEAAREVMEAEVDEILLIGNAANSLSGLFTLSGTVTTTVTTGVGGTLWSAKTGPEKVADLHACVNAIVTGSNDRIHPNTLVLPLTAYNDLNETNMGTGTDLTALEYFIRNSRYITSVESSIHLESNAAWTGRRMVAYKKDPKMLQGVIPQEFEQLAPEIQGYETVINCHLRIGGIELYQPKSVGYLDTF